MDSHEFTVCRKVAYTNVTQSCVTLAAGTPPLHCSNGMSEDREGTKKSRMEEQERTGSGRKWDGIAG